MTYRRLFSAGLLVAAFTLAGAVNAASAQGAAVAPSVQDSLQAIIEKLNALEKRLDLVEARSGGGANNAAGFIADQIEVLDQQIKVAERKREIANDDAATAAAATPVVTAGTGGFALQSNNGDYRLAIGMVAQMDGRFSLNTPKPITNTFTIRKLRPAFSGRVAKYFDFKVMPDFGNGATVIQDAYFDIRFSSRFRIRTGKDKTPIGHEVLQGDAYLLFPERALASGLIPNRDIGVQAQGDLAGTRVSYSVGVFNGIPDGSSTTTEADTNNSKDLAGRIVLQPFKSTRTPSSLFSGLGFQLGGSTGRQIGALPSFKTSAGQTYFSYASTAAAGGDRRRISPSVFYYYKAFGAFGEYIRSAQSIARVGVGTAVTNQAWEFSGSLVLTGEAASDRGVKPKNNFDPAKNQWGALQLVGRYTKLVVDRDAFAAGLTAANVSRDATSFTLGANWYPATFIKYYLNYERTVFDGATARPTENVILFRTQLAF